MSSPGSNHTDEEDYMAMIVGDDGNDGGTAQTHFGRESPKIGIGQNHKRKRTVLFGEIPDSEESEEEGQTSTNEASTNGAKPPSKKSIGMNIMERMGYKPGARLGSDINGKGLLSPIEVQQRKGRVGLGAEPKTAYLHTSNSGSPNEEPDELSRSSGEPANDEDELTEFRKRVSQEKKADKIGRQIRKLQYLCLQLAEDTEGTSEKSLADSAEPQSVDLSRINVLWRRLFIHNPEPNEHLGGLISAGSYALENSEELGSIQSSEEVLKQVSHDNTGINSTIDGSLSAQELLTGEPEVDEELDEFEALPLEEQRDKLNDFLRNQYLYCFWCGCRYTDEADLAENCPGPTEEDHV